MTADQLYNADDTDGSSVCEDEEWPSTPVPGPTADMKAREAIELLQEAREHLRQNKYGEAHHAAKDAQSLFRDAGRLAEELASYFCIAQALVNQGEIQHALEVAEEARGRCVKTDHALAESNLLVLIANIHLAELDHLIEEQCVTQSPSSPSDRKIELQQKVVKTATAALEVSRKSRDDNCQATALYLMGRAHLAVQKGDEARRFTAQAQKLFRALGDVDMEGTSLLFLAELCLNLDRKQEALAALRQARTLYRTLGDTAKMKAVDELQQRISGPAPMTQIRAPVGIHTPLPSVGAGTVKLPVSGLSRIK